MTDNRWEADEMELRAEVSRALSDGERTGSHGGTVDRIVRIVRRYYDPALADLYAARRGVEW